MIKVYILLTLLAVFLLGIAAAYRAMTKKPDGIFYINLTDPIEETMKLQIDVPIEDIPNQKYLILKVQKTQ